MDIKGTIFVLQIVSGGKKEWVFSQCQYLCQFSVFDHFEPYFVMKVVSICVILGKFVLSHVNVCQF
jgi:hypothetical protein